MHRYPAIEVSPPAETAKQIVRAEYAIEKLLAKGGISKHVREHLHAALDNLARAYEGASPDWHLDSVADGNKPWHETS